MTPMSNSEARKREAARKRREEARIDHGPGYVCDDADCPTCRITRADGPAAHLLRCLVRAWLTILGHRLDRRVCRWPNQTGDDT